jgi:hypothetical protein
MLLADVLFELYGPSSDSALIPPLTCWPCCSLCSTAKRLVIPQEAVVLHTTCETTLILVAGVIGNISCDGPVMGHSQASLVVGWYLHLYDGLLVLSFDLQLRSLPLCGFFSFPLLFFPCVFACFIFFPSRQRLLIHSFLLWSIKAGLFIILCNHDCLTICPWSCAHLSCFRR